VARRRTKSPEVVLDQEFEPTVAEAAPAAAEPTAPRARRSYLRIPLSEHGVPDLSSLDPNKRAALVDAVGKLPERAQVDPALAGMLIGAIAQLEAAILARKYNLPRDEMARIAQPKPPLDELLARQAAIVLSKHNVFGRFGDELALAALAASWQAGVIQAANDLARSKAEAEKRKTESQSHASNNVSEA
jgi:hypothetical protein